MEQTYYDPVEFREVYKKVKKLEEDWGNLKEEIYTYKGNELFKIKELNKEGEFIEKSLEKYLYDANEVFNKMKDMDKNGKNKTEDFKFNYCNIGNIKKEIEFEMDLFNRLYVQKSYSSFPQL